MGKILLVCNESNFVINFRKELINYFVSKKHEVYVACADDERKNEIESLASKCFTVPLNNRSLSIKKLFKSYSLTKRIIEEINPDIVFTFQTKPNVVGGIAARKFKKIKYFCMVEGLGDPFQPKNFKEKILRKIVCMLYKKAFKKAEKVFFLNNDDKFELIKRKIVLEKQCVVIPGIGIDLKLFNPNYEKKSSKNIIMLSRLIKNKGILEYCQVARIVREKRPDIHFFLYGGESQLTKNDITDYINDGSIIYGGYVKNVIELIKSSTIMISTSFYREGFPRTILEAMALGKPVIATNTIGNRDAVIDGQTGYLVQMHDVEEMTQKIIKIIDDDELLEKIGRQARKVCEERYDSNIINGILYDYIFLK